MVSDCRYRAVPLCDECFQVLISHELWGSEWDVWMKVPSKRFARYQSHKWKYRYPLNAYELSSWGESSYSHLRKGQQVKAKKAPNSEAKKLSKSVVRIPSKAQGKAPPKSVIKILSQPEIPQKPEISLPQSAAELPPKPESPLLRSAVPELAKSTTELSPKEILEEEESFDLIFVPSEKSEMFESKIMNDDLFIIKEVKTY